MVANATRIASLAGAGLLSQAGPLLIVPYSCFTPPPLPGDDGIVLGYARVEAGLQP